MYSTMAKRSREAVIIIYNHVFSSVLWPRMVMGSFYNFQKQGNIQYNGFKNNKNKLMQAIHFCLAPLLFSKPWNSIRIQQSYNPNTTKLTSTKNLTKFYKLSDISHRMISHYICPWWILSLSWFTSGGYSPRLVCFRWRVAIPCFHLWSIPCLLWWCPLLSEQQCLHYLGWVNQDPERLWLYPHCCNVSSTTWEDASLNWIRPYI